MCKFIFNLGCTAWFAAAMAGYAADDRRLPQTAPKTPEDLRREAAVAAFTQKQEAANWPEKFERIGKEMGVPPDILAAVSFAETRWDHLTWPPGETASPENGMPRPYGVMSLMDNEFFGHSLIEAAKLIGKSPEDLKTDPELNIRGAAALLKKLYGENALPDGTTADDIESWQNAIMRYCGIPEDYLSYDHAYSCYVYMTQGYDQYGMHWKPHPVNLMPMKARRDKYMKAQGELVRAREALTPGQLATATSPTPPTTKTPAEILTPLTSPTEPKFSVTTIVTPTRVDSALRSILLALAMMSGLLFAWWLLKPKKG